MIVNKQKIKIATIVIYVLICLVYELLYCNTGNVYSLIEQGVVAYDFSLVRITLYLLGSVLFFKWGDSFVQTAETNFQSKKRRIIVYTLFIIDILSILGIILVVNKFELVRLYALSIILLNMIIISSMYISKNISKNVIILSLTFGILFSIQTDFNHAIDEKRHFITAYNISQFNFDYVENPITDIAIEQIPQLSEVQKLNDNLFHNFEEERIDVNKEDIASTPTTYSFVLYIPSAIGIFIAEKLGGSIVDMYILGRVINMIMYTILIFFSIKLIPYKKNLILVLAYIPMILLLASSYSIDGYCVGLVFLFIAYVFNLYEKDRALKPSEIIKLLLLFGAMLLPKDMSYIFVTIIVLMLPIIKTVKANKKFIIGLTLILLIAFVGLLALVISTFQNDVISDIRGGEGISKEGQIDYLLENPIQSIIFFGKHIIIDTMSNFLWLGVINSIFGELSNNIFIIIFVFILYVAFTENDKNFQLKNKIIMFISYIAVFMPISILLYISFTPVANSVINGFHTRYIIPILPLILASISSKNIKILNPDSRIINISLIISSILTISSIQLILN